jgi:hypothetical protein
MNWHFRTVGMGTYNIRAAAHRIVNEAADTGLFQTSKGFSEKQIRLLMPTFWTEHKQILKARIPGFGWYIWKPYFIHEMLNSIPEGDGLLYLDSGCTISKSKESFDQIADFLKIAEKYGIVGSNSDAYTEQNYTSEDLMTRYKLTPEQRISNQYCAALLFVVNDFAGREFTNEWRQMVCSDNHKWVLPQSYSLPNNSQFIHHMYDQAILSCLLKYHQKPSVITGTKETLGAIRLSRHRYGYSLDNHSLITKMCFDFLGKISKIYLAVQRRIFWRSRNLRPKSHKDLR